MISFQTFLNKLTRGISEYYGDTYRVEINKIQKNNGMIYCGLTIMDASSNLSPTIYMEEMYRRYTDGEALSEIMGEVIRIYESSRIEGNVDLRFFLDFNQVRERIVYKLVHYGRNRQMLSDLPHIRILDMAAVCYCGVLHEVLGSITILVRKGMCRLWGVEEAELFRLAKENTPRILPAQICPMEEVMREEERNICREPGESCMYVLTNGRKLFGAACMMYPGILREFAEKTEADIYILPSSVHEVILIPDRSSFGREEFEKIVREMNGTCVQPEEVLSDRVYYYDRDKDRII